MPRPSGLPRLCALVLLAVALLASACASVESGSTQVSGGDDDDADAGPPQYGGRVVYGVEAETTNGWCLPEGQLAISGIQVARSIYDTLTVPNADGQFVPFLAESVTSNPEFTEWTITLRPDIVFHDGSPLTAEVVKNNLDAYRGQYPARTSLLFQFVLSDIAAVDVTGPLTVRVTTDRPWSSFPSFLYSSGRHGDDRPVPARRPRPLRHRPHRHRPVPTGRVAGQRPPVARAQRGLLAHRRRRQPAPLPRRARVPPGDRAAAAHQRAQVRRARRLPHLDRPDHRRDAGARRGRAGQHGRVRGARRGGVPDDQRHEAAVRQPDGPLRHRQRAAHRARQRDQRQGHPHDRQRAVRARLARLRRGHRHAARRPAAGPRAGRAVRGRDRTAAVVHDHLDARARHAAPRPSSRRRCSRRRAWT